MTEDSEHRPEAGDAFPVPTDSNLVPPAAPDSQVENEGEQADLSASASAEEGTKGSQEAPEVSGEPVFRPFRSWASAYEPTPSVWSRMKDRISGVFSRKKVEDAEKAEEEIRDTADALVLRETTDTADATEPLELEASGAAVTEAQDEALSTEIVWLESAPTPAHDAPSLEAVPEIVAEDPQESTPRSIDELTPVADEPVETSPDEFTLLADERAEIAADAFAPAADEPAEINADEFTPLAGDAGDGPTSDDQPVAPPEDFRFPWARSEQPAADTEFATVDEALPVSQDLLDAEIETEPLDAEEVVVAPPPKRGFFARLFGRRSAETVDEDQPRLSVEVYQDRIEAAANAVDVDAAANALDEAGEFTPGEDTLSITPAESYASVEEALPAADEFAVSAYPEVTTEPELPAEPDVVTDPGMLAEPETSGEPEVASEAAQAAELFGAAESSIESMDAGTDFSVARDTLEVYEPLQPPDTESRSTLEVGPVEGLEVEEESGRATMEVEQTFDAPETEGRDTLELTGQEIEEKTDEFEIVPPPPPVEQPAMVEDKTLSVEQPSTSFIKRLFRRGDTQVETPAAQKATQASAVFLITKFRAFYSEIIRFRHQKSEFAGGFATALMVTDYTADLSPAAAAEGLSKRLSELLELQAAEAKWMGGEAGDLYPDAQYSMAALADELFTHLEWDGQAAWPQFSVEKRLFQSNAADVEVFRRIDKLLKAKPDSAVARDLARVYLLVLAAGFQGKYRPFGLTRALAEYRQRLFEYIHDADPLMLYAPERRIFPEAVSRTLAGQAVSRFSTAQRWTAILVLLAAGYVTVAHFAWNRVSADLRDVTSRIKAGYTSGAR